MFQIEVERVFAASHAIRLPDGNLEPLHGHNWPVRVQVESEGLDGIETVMDFHVLEAMLGTVLAAWHNRHLNDCAPFGDGHGGLQFNPTAERVAWAIGRSFIGNLPAGVRLVSVRVGEAPQCWAIWRP